MKKLFTLALCMFGLGLSLSAQSFKKSLQKFQKELNRSYADPNTSPLPMDKLQGFNGLPFYPLDESFLVTAKFELLPASNPFNMKTSDQKLRDYDRYALATFTLAGEEFQLTLYKSRTAPSKPEYKDLLFIPFTDKTNGKESYGGGRYMDVKIPAGDTIEIDFNKAYNPYCAYSDRYSCPIPPAENDLAIPIRAGVKYSN